MFTQAAKVRNEELAGGGPSLPVPGVVRRLVHRLAEYPRRFRQFLHEVRVELKQVTWPTRNDVYATTAVVIVTVFFFGLYLFLVDLGVSRVVERMFSIFKKF